MKIRDLSIGDWAFINGEPARVLRLTQVGYSIFKGLSGQMYRGLGDSISPLPITPEILNQNGFSLVVKNNRFDDWHNHPIIIRKYDYEDHYRLIANGWVMPFKMFSVHQLQHALRLFEVEKDIIL